MPTYVVLLRALNVGGRTCAMADLRRHLETSGLSDVETYIQTGNVRFRTPMRSPARVEEHVERVLGEALAFEVPAVVLSPVELREVHEDATDFGSPEVEGVAAELGVPVNAFASVFKVGAAPQGEAARRIADWGSTPEGRGEAAVVRGRAVHVRIAGPMHEARFFGAFKKPLAAGTVRNLAVLTTLAQRWGG